MAIALAALAAGGGMLLMVYLAARRLANHAGTGAPPAPVAHEVVARVADADEGVLVAQHGGRAVYANERARRLFDLDGGRPDLNRMAALAEPRTAFYELLAGPSQTRLHIRERPVEAISFPVPDAQPPQYVVLLRDAEPFAELAAGADEGGAHAAALAVVSELNELVAASLDLDETLDAILKLVRRALSFQLAELWLWESAGQRLHSGRRTGEQKYIRAVERLNDDYEPAAGVPGWIARGRRRLLVADTAQEREPRTLLPNEVPLRSVLGIPLERKGELIGTLHIGAREPDAFDAADTVILETIAATAAIAIFNAQQYARERTQVSELSGLMQVAQTSALIADARDLNSTLTERIASLMGVAICGILLYDEEEAALLPQQPFHGIPDMFADSLRIPVPPGSAAERLWREQEYWLTNRFASDPTVGELGLTHLAGAFGMENALLVPLVVGGRRIGAIHAANKTHGAFGEADARRLAAIASQAAALVDNARLVREAEARARLAEGANRIADLAGSRLSLDDIVEQVCAEAATLFDADYGLVFLLDEGRGELSAHPRSVVDRTLEGSTTLPALERADAAQMDSAHPAYRFTVTASAEPFYSARASEDQSINRLYRPARSQLQAECMMLVPLVAGGRGLGELWLASRTPFGLRKLDLPVLATIGAHLASAIERSRLGAATDESLRRRVDQLSSLARVSRELNRTLDLEQILQAVHDEALRTTGADGGSIALLDLDAGKPHARQRLGKGFARVELSTVEREVALSGEGRMVGDLSAAAEDSPHPQARSALIVPIAYQNQTVGLINLHSERRFGFDDAQLEFILALAGHAAIAVGNAQRYEEQMQRGELLRRRADQLAQLLRISRSIRSDEPLPATLEAIAFGIRDAVGFNVVSISVLDANTNQLHAAAAAGLPLAAFEELKSRAVDWEPLEETLRDEFRVSQSYFIPHARQTDVLTQAVAGATSQRPTADGWQPGDLLLVRLSGSGGQPLGMVALDEPRSGSIPERGTVETVEIFANQAALAIENARLYEAAEQRAAELADSLATVQKSYRELDEVSRSLQEKDAELRQLVARLDVRNARLLALHHISSATIGAARPDALLQTVTDQLRREMKVDVAMIVDGDDASPRTLGLSGDLPAQMDLDAVLGAGNVLTRAAREGAPIVMQRRRASQWEDDPLVKALQLRSFAAVPFRSEQAQAGALFVGSRSGEQRFSAEDLDLFTILAQQVALSLENARLLADVRERAAQLQALTEVSRAITSMLRVEDVVAHVLEQVGSVIPFDSAALWLREGEFLRVAAATGFEDDEDRLGLMVELQDSALFTEMADRREPIVVADVREDARFPGSAISPSRAWMGVPLASKGQVLGLIALDKVEVDFYRAGHVDLARAFANQAAVALDNARLFEESVERALDLNERTQRLQLLNRLSSELGTTLDKVHALAVSVEYTAQALAVEQAAVILFDDKRGVARLTAEYPSRPHPPLDVDFPLDDNAFVEQLRGAGAALAVEDVEAEPLLDPIRPMLARRAVRSALIMPLNAGGRVIGFIQLEELQRQRRFRAGEIELAQTIANQSAIAVQNARLFEEAQQRLIELDTINHISRAITATMDLEQLMTILREQITALLETENVYVALYDWESDEVTFPLYYRDGIPVEMERRNVGGLTERIIRSGKPLRMSGKLEVAEADLGAGESTGQRLARSYFGLPLLAGDRVTGVVTVLDYERYDAFTRTHERILNTLAAQVAVAIENARLFGEVRAASEELEQRIAERTHAVQEERDRVETLLRMTRELSASLDLDSVLTRALMLVNDSIDASQGSLYLLDPLTDGLTHRAALGSAEPLPTGGAPAPFGRKEGLVGWVLQHREPTISNNLPEDERWRTHPSAAEHRSALVAPVVAGEDLLGALAFYSEQPDAFSEAQLQLVSAAANQVASAVNNSELYRLIRDQAERLGGMLRSQQVEASKSRAILEAVADGVMVSDVAGEIILFNRSAELILRLEREAIVGRPVNQMIGLYGAAAQSWLRAIDRWKGDPGAYRPGDFLAERFELDGNRIVSVHIAPVIHNDEYIGSVSLFRDITRDVEVDRLKTEFVTTVSHELRTPMTSIKGYADLLLSGAGGPLEGMQRDFVDTIKSNADRLRELVEDLLDISRIESGKVELKLTLVDLQAVLKEAVSDLRGLINEGDTKIEVIDDLPDSLPPVHGDEVRLLQIFSNLADNAYAYTPGGGTVTIRARTIMGTIQVDVQDTGIGLEPHERARIFDRFFRGDDPLVLASSGAGLGLNIVHQLVEMHGGQIWVESAGRGQGSTFSVLLPTAESGPLAEDQAGRRKRKAESATSATSESS